MGQFSAVVFLCLFVALSAGANGTCARLLNASPGYAVLKDIHIVIEGVGDVVKNFYSPALEKVVGQVRGSQNVRVTFIDNSVMWRRSGDPVMIAKMEKTIADVRRWGAHYVDKSDPNVSSQTLARLNPDYVIVATPDRTHVQIATEWLERSNTIRQIYVEKPIDSSLSQARHLLGVSNPASKKVMAYDHYRIKLLPTQEQKARVKQFLGTRLRSAKFYFLEDHSGADPKFSNIEGQRHGPIENERRVPSLQNGLIMDLLSHLPPILEHFMPIDSMFVSHVKAAKYTGVDGSDANVAEIRGETLAQVDFVVQDRKEHFVNVRAFVGKGVKGSRELGPQFDRNSKSLILEGENGRKILFDLRSGVAEPKAYFISKNGKVIGTFPLNPNPYQVFMEKLVDGSHLRDSVALHAGYGKKILEFLLESKAPIEDALNRGEALPTYPTGIKDVRDSLYIEDIFARLPSVFGRDPGNN